MRPLIGLNNANSEINKEKLGRRKIVHVSWFVSKSKWLQNGFGFTALPLYIHVHILCENITVLYYFDFHLSDSIGDQPWEATGRALQGDQEERISTMSPRSTLEILGDGPSDKTTEMQVNRLYKVGDN